MNPLFPDLFKRLLLATLAFASTPLCAQSGQSGAGFGTIWESVTILLVGAGLFYFMVLRPEMAKRAAREEEMKALKRGDKVVATGIIGTVKKVSKEQIIVTMWDGSDLAFLPEAISHVVPGTKGAQE